MTSPARLLFVGLDACDPGIAQGLAASGYLPSLQRLFERAGRCAVRNPFGLFVGALWVTFATGQRPDKHRFHCWDQIDVATYLRQLTEPWASTEAFWHRLSTAGRRVAVLDVPHSKADLPVDGIQIVEWGCHDRHFGFHTWPPSLASDIEAAFDLHPIFGIDAYSKREFAADDYIHRAATFRTVEEDRTFFHSLRAGVGAKRRLSSTLLAQGGWDLFLAVFGESHAIGHQQWHLHDSAHARFDPARVQATGGDPIFQIYREIDTALGDLLAQVDDETTILVLLSHGMGPHYDGTHLLDEILTRIDVYDRTANERSGPEIMLRRAATRLPGRLQQQVTAFAVPALRRRIAGKSLAPCAEFAGPEARARQHFFMEPNNSVFGGVRINLAGREPKGCVRPDEFDAVCKRLTEDLLALVNIATGKPVIRAVERSGNWHRRAADDTMPDLFIDWERSVPIETVWSVKVGAVHAPYLHWRTGDHRPDGLLLALGPGIPTASTALPALDLEDLGPSIAGRLGVTLKDVDGRAVPWLAS